MTRLGIVTGMQFEADILRAELAKAGAPDGIAVACAGPSYVSAKRVAARLVDEGSQALLSFGIAGGLLEGLKPGTLLIASEVINWGEAIEADKAWMARLRLAIGTPRFPMEVGNLAHSDPPAATPADKRSLHIQTQALGVDMESFAVAETARAKGVPFITLRVVADESRSLLPMAALAATNPDGSVSTGRTLATLASHPWEMVDLIRLGMQTAKARKTLRDLALLGVPRLFFM